MVHALREVRRVLASGGVLVDLRPLLNRWPVELASSTAQHLLGRATDLAAPLSDDAAANAAMAEASESGQWVRELQEEFPLFYYWDTPGEMKDYIADEWSDVITVDEAVWRDLKSAWATANPDAHVRLRMKMLITRYRKAGTDS